MEMEMQAEPQDDAASPVWAGDDDDDVIEYRQAPAKPKPEPKPEPKPKPEVPAAVAPPHETELVPYRRRPSRPLLKRVFTWLFSGIQLFFVIWFTIGFMNANDGDTGVNAQATQFCARKVNWQQYKSQTACVKQYAGTLTTSTDIHRWVDVTFIVLIWIMASVLTVLTYAICRQLARPLPPGAM